MIKVHRAFGVILRSQTDVIPTLNLSHESRDQNSTKNQRRDDVGFRTLYRRRNNYVALTLIFGRRRRDQFSTNIQRPFDVVCLQGTDFKYAKHIINTTPSVRFTHEINKIG